MPTPTARADTVAVRAPEPPKNDRAMSVTSRSIANGAPISPDHVFTGCGGKNVSPQLSWTGAPAGTKSFAITCFDPDAPTGSGYWHWLVCNVPPSVSSLDAGAGTGKSPAGGKGALNDLGLTTYAGPCPPTHDIPHRYIFTVYALDVASLDDVGDTTTGASFIFNLRGHVLASGSVTGLFSH
jgi:Raf kinase inhibitor-like YbhB/YbcL family protein